MRSWSSFLAAAFASWLALSGRASAMGSGPHPHLAYGLPPTPASAPTGDPVAVVGLVLALAGMGIAVLRTWKKRAP
jgi:hypothetical protein